MRFLKQLRVAVNTTQPALLPETRGHLETSALQFSQEVRTAAARPCGGCDTPPFSSVAARTCIRCVMPTSLPTQLVSVHMCDASRVRPSLPASRADISEDFSKLPCLGTAMTMGTPLVGASNRSIRYS